MKNTNIVMKKLILKKKCTNVEIILIEINPKKMFVKKSFLFLKFIKLPRPERDIKIAIEKNINKKDCKIITY